MAKNTAVAKPQQKKEKKAENGVTKAKNKVTGKDVKVAAKPQKVIKKTNTAAPSPQKQQKKTKALVKPVQKKPVAQPKSDTPKPEGLVTVFVGNLPINIKRKKVLSTFGKFGKVFGIRFRKPNGGRFFKSADKSGETSLIAFVDYANIDDAKSSTSLNGEKIGENIIRVQVHLNKTKDKAAIIASYDPKRTVFIGNLPYAANDRNLTETFSCCGEIDYVRTLNATGKNKGCNGTAYVCFKDSASVGMALELNGNEFLGREMRVQRYSAKAVASASASASAGAGEGKKKTEKSGAERRVEGKNKKAGTEFAGTKTTDQKMKKKNNKGGLSGPKLLAKKIAPRQVPVTA